ncbi:glycosyltransferase family 61 protein [Pedobacter sandarakinus]|uniref:glycosyltransferase family 61 protein n=1 Tax=Pedobacter sandarakinus TaxID=353156 RepID=UPI002247C772|nr:glycosyltransferase family 61 protein [Pedobacter sandarakinus]MCX2575921.1 glycosyltransferase family 61 protein [Pedobacter sandarakinus]
MGSNPITKMLYLLKRSIIIFFTKNPYRIDNFANVFRDQGLSIDRPETLNFILSYEHGDGFRYMRNAQSYGNQPKHRTIKNKDRFVGDVIFKAPDRTVYSVSNGSIFGQLGLVFSAEKRAYILESTQEWTVDLKYSKLTNIVKFPKREMIDGVVFSLLTNGADGGFFHFILESLPKLALYKPFLAKDAKILINGPCTEWKIKWLLLAGVSESDIVWVTNTSHYKCKQLIFSNRIVADQQVNPWAIAVLRKLLTLSSGKLGVNKKIIWLSRAKEKSRHILWEEHILSSLPMIQKIDLALYNCEDTIKTMQSATHVIAPHGAALCNVLFCCKGTKVLELFELNTFYQPCYSRLSSLCELDHHVASLDFVDQQNDTNGNSHLREILEQFLC